MPILKTDKKKDGLVQYRVIVNYKAADGVYKKAERTVYGLAQAREAERKLKIDVFSSKAQNMTVADLVSEFQLIKKHEVRESSLNELEKRFRLYIVPLVGKQKIHKLSPSVLEKWKSALQEKSLAVSTKKKAYSAFRSLMGYAIRMGYVEKNPLDRIRNFVDTEFSSPEKAIQFYTPDQFLVFKRTAEESCATIADRSYYVFFMIAYYTGMRKGEINALKWSDIDENVIRVRRSITQKLVGEDRETAPKTKASIRDIQIPTPLLRVLEEHKRAQETLSDYTSDFRVCGGTMVLRDSTIDNKNRAWASAAGLPRIRVHDFRHSHASLLANEGINIQEIARRLGHSDVNVTWKIYAHLYPREEERALKILDKIE